MEEVEQESEVEGFTGDGEPIFDEEVTYGDQGESLVVLCNLNTSLAKEENSQRNNLFHTRCTAHGKICEVIIDGGSCENMVATTMVEKLNLSTEKYPRPYKLSWLRKDNEVRVDQKCLV